MNEQRRLCERLKLKGRIIIASEGINGTVEGTEEAIDKYIQNTQKNPLFADINFKKSSGTGNSFPKLSVKVRPEIVSAHLGESNVNPARLTGKYITAEKLHTWMYGKHKCASELHNSEAPARLCLKNKKEFYIVDMRNDFEQKSGYFENSIFAGLTQFRDLRLALPRLKHLKNKTIVTVCTGGVRCEKASGFLIANGFTDVYQLKDGIVSYMEKYPNLDFVGKLYVFDQRIVMGFNTEDALHKIAGRCEVCGQPCEHYINCLDSDCHRHFICCKDCLQGKEAILCPTGCRNSGYDSV